MKRHVSARSHLGLALLACLSTATAAMAQQEAPPMQVGTITLERQAVPRIVTLPGRAVAYQQVDIRPRVGGVVEEILYTPGADLSVGDPLFRIDDASYRASVAAAQSDLATAQANLPVAQSAKDRAEQLAGRGYTEAEVDSARASLAEAQATLDAAQAALDYAQTELSWTTITSPIEGVAEVASVSVGDLVTSGQSDALTTVTRLDPIEVEMLEASARMLELRQEIASGTLEQNPELEARLLLETGAVYEGTGRLVSPGNTVSTTTGTFTVRFRFDNPDRMILPGMFLRGEITVGTINAFLVPQRAAERSNSGALTVYVVGADGTSEQVTLNEMGAYENAWIVPSGLDDGAQLIVDGLKSMQPGLPVSPVAVEIDENGLTQDLPAAAASDSGN
ncbi:efflux RND transporter periplasmic adaptor subunit [Marinibacterium sp. SX1]|uniref:efflux RND transporter periplasmic adaptor subunit n=1 Tax=Marinibacterium sp. SX1 TaxID=3388424 RepID=UPI003D16C887